MKTFRTILLIAGILVAGLALNTSFAQTSHERDKKDKSTKSELKAEKKAHPMLKSKSHKHEIKEQRKHEQKSEMKAQKSIHKKQKARAKASEGN